eukprot:gene20789-27616_t
MDPKEKLHNLAPVNLTVGRVNTSRSATSVPDGASARAFELPWTPDTGKGSFLGYSPLPLLSPGRASLPLFHPSPRGTPSSQPFSSHHFSELTALEAIFRSPLHPSGAGDLLLGSADQDSAFRFDTPNTRAALLETIFTCTPKNSVDSQPQTFTSTPKHRVDPQPQMHSSESKSSHRGFVDLHLLQSLAGQQPLQTSQINSGLKQRSIPTSALEQQTSLRTPDVAKFMSLGQPSLARDLQDQHQPLAASFLSTHSQDQHQPLASGFLSPRSRYQHQPLASGFLSPRSRYQHQPLASGFQSPRSRYQHQPLGSGFLSPRSQDQQQPLSADFLSPRSLSMMQDFASEPLDAGATKPVYRQQKPGPAQTCNTRMSPFGLVSFDTLAVKTPGDNVQAAGGASSLHGLSSLDLGKTLDDERLKQISESDTSQDCGLPPPRESKSDIMNSSQGKDPIGNKTCHCKKSQCLKLYCDCFASGLFCANCACIHCKNRPEHGSQVMEKRDIIMSRDPEGGVKCAAHCKCVDCKNLVDAPDHDSGLGGGAAATAGKVAVATNSIDSSPSLDTASRDPMPPPDGKVAVATNSIDTSPSLDTASRDPMHPPDGLCLEVRQDLKRATSAQGGDPFPSCQPTPTIAYDSVRSGAVIQGLLSLPDHTQQLLQPPNTQALIQGLLSSPEHTQKLLQTPNTGAVIRGLLSPEQVQQLLQTPNTVSSKMLNHPFGLTPSKQPQDCISNQPDGAAVLVPTPFSDNSLQALGLRSSAHKPDSMLGLGAPPWASNIHRSSSLNLGPMEPSLSHQLVHDPAAEKEIGLAQGMGRRPPGLTPVKRKSSSLTESQNRQAYQLCQVTAAEQDIGLAQVMGRPPPGVTPAKKKSSSLTESQSQQAYQLCQDTGAAQDIGLAQVMGRPPPGVTPAKKKSSSLTESQSQQAYQLALDTVAASDVPLAQVMGHPPGLTLGMRKSSSLTESPSQQANQLALDTVAANDTTLAQVMERPPPGLTPANRKSSSLTESPSRQAYQLCQDSTAAQDIGLAQVIGGRPPGLTPAKRKSSSLIKAPSQQAYQLSQDTSAAQDIGLAQVMKGVHPGVTPAKRQSSSLTGQSPDHSEERDLSGLDTQAVGSASTMSSLQAAKQSAFAYMHARFHGTSGGFGSSPFSGDVSQPMSLLRGRTLSVKAPTPKMQRQAASDALGISSFPGTPTSGKEGVPSLEALLMSDINLGEHMAHSPCDGGQQVVTIKLAKVSKEVPEVLLRPIYQLITSIMTQLTDSEGENNTPRFRIMDTARVYCLLSLG